MYRTLFTALFVFLLELRCALTAPTGSGESQIALDTYHDEQSGKVRDTVTTVSIGFRSTSTKPTEHIEIPLGKRVPIRDFPTLPKKPSRGKIMGTYATQSGPGGTYRHALDTAADRTLCMVYPKALSATEDNLLWGHSRDYAAKSPSGKALLAQSKGQATVWFNVDDGWIDFNSAKGRWWLKGSEIEALECR